MPRPLRIEYPGAWYHILHRLRPNPSLFRSQIAYLAMLDLIGKTSQLFELECHAFCLTPKEIHLLIRTPQGQLSKAMKYLFGGFTKRVATLTHLPGPFFVDRYKSILIDPDQIADISRYLHWVPVLLKKAATPEAYPWSSVGAYIKSVPSGWLMTHTILGTFHKPIPHQAYRLFLNEGISPQLAKFYKSKKKSPILGSEIFIRQTLEKTNQNRIETMPPPDMDTLIRSVSEILAEPVDHILTSRRGRNNQQTGRSFAMYLCRHLGRYPIAQIATKFNVTHYSAVSVRIRRFRTVLQKNPRLKAKLDLLVKTAGKFNL